MLLVEVLTLGNLNCERSSDQMGGGHFNARSLCGYLSHTSSAHIESLHIFTVLRLSHGLEGDTVACETLARAIDERDLVRIAVLQDQWLSAA